ncbi:hypothetical protein H2198_004889 [Neophaeococcomyces mojaviensis]|uniref:Uncharacterized protein n=1 Tax=Neophaeococcomyces mojaviensis TaxID=3383035 RepID=A0ACC3A793_9EURO|nr:hypothetical protein H2198_004889 [Knufia sp. JES_112]
MSVRPTSRSIFDTLSRSSPSNHICRQCRRTLTPQQQRYASSALSSNGQSPQRTIAQRHAIPALFQSGKTQRTLVSVARRDKEEVDDAGVTGARTWEGLPIIGHGGDWKDMPETVQDDYQSWHGTALPTLSHEQLTAFLFQAIVECHTCSELGIAETLAAGSHARSLLSPDLFETATIAISPKHTIQGVQHPNLDADTTEVLQEKLQSPVESENTQTQAENTQIYLPSPEQQSFLDARIKPNNPMTFTILKRFSFLIGRRIPDPLLTTLTQKPTNTYRHLVTALNEHLAPKPANVIEKLAMNQTLANQSNVLVFPRRETPVDKEKEVGRWKIIEEELKKRGLPVLGRTKVQE